jgi:hypothetical protein
MEYRTDERLIRQAEFRGLGAKQHQGRRCLVCRLEGD